MAALRDGIEETGGSMLISSYFFLCISASLQAIWLQKHSDDISVQAGA